MEWESERDWCWKREVKAAVVASSRCGGRRHWQLERVVETCREEGKVRQLCEKELRREGNADKGVVMMVWRVNRQ